MEPYIDIVIPVHPTTGGPRVFKFDWPSEYQHRSQSHVLAETAGGSSELQFASRFKTYTFQGGEY